MRQSVSFTVECESFWHLCLSHAYGRCAFERRIPYDLRCRTALVSLPSAYPDARVAETESPALNRRDLRRAFEQHWLALIVSETIVNLNRPYFIKALVERPEDPTRTAHGQAFLSVLERSNVSSARRMWLTAGSHPDRLYIVRRVSIGHSSPLVVLGESHLLDKG
jgi:hypothetical protein